MIIHLRRHLEGDVEGVQDQEEVEEEAISRLMVQPEAAGVVPTAEEGVALLKVLLLQIAVQEVGEGEVLRLDHSLPLPLHSQLQLLLLLLLLLSQFVMPPSHRTSGAKAALGLKRL